MSDDNREKLGQVVEKLLPSLQRQARFLTRNKANADDLVGDLLLRAVRKSNQGLLRYDRGINGCLFLMLRREFFSLLKRNKGLEKCPPGGFAADEMVEDTPYEEGGLNLTKMDMAAAISSASARSEFLMLGEYTCANVSGRTDEMVDMFQRCEASVSRLPPHLYHLFEASVLRGLSTEEICDETGIVRNTVYSGTAKVRARMSKVLSA